MLSVLGKGSFGQVLEVLDYKTGTYKALKVIRNKKRFHHQAQVQGRACRGASRVKRVVALPCGANGRRAGQSTAGSCSRPRRQGVDPGCASCHNVTLSPARPQVELRVLEHLKAHDPADAHGCVRMEESFLFRGHLCITFEMLGMNL